MKKASQLILAVIALITVVSCERNTTNNQEQLNVEEIKTEETHESDTVLRLNNSNLWIANSETTTGINNMIELMNSFSKKESHEAYNKLKLELENEFGTIIKECTMQGEPHNQLHHFLMPMQEMFDGLASSNLQLCKEKYNSLNNHLKEYAKYFK